MRGARPEGLFCPAKPSHFAAWSWSFQNPPVLVPREGSGGSDLHQTPCPSLRIPQAAPTDDPWHSASPRQKLGPGIRHLNLYVAEPQAPLMGLANSRGRTGREGQEGRGGAGWAGGENPPFGRLRHPDLEFQSLGAQSNKIEVFVDASRSSCSRHCLRSQTFGPAWD